MSGGIIKKSVSKNFGHLTNANSAVVTGVRHKTCCIR